MADNGNGDRANGRVVRVIGPVVDVDFPPDELPEINTALEVERTLDDSRRIMPYLQSGFGRRMRTEYVLVFRRSD